MKSFCGLIMVLALVALVGCDGAIHSGAPATPVSASGVKEARTTVQTHANGQTVEQENIIQRLKIDNTPGSIKHLYIISPMSGQCILYSTVMGKVTSSGKRLTPTTVASGQNCVGEGISTATHPYGVPVNIGGRTYHTGEVLQDDGTYGQSIEYLYWFDARGVYHQHYYSACEIHVSDQPMPIKNVIINIESGVGFQGRKPAEAATK